MLEAPPSPRVHYPDLPARLEQIILKTLEKEPDQRYQSMAALAADLEKTLHTPNDINLQTQPKLPGGPPEKTRALALPRKVPVLPMAIGGIILAILAAAMLIPGIRNALFPQPTPTLAAVAVAPTETDIPTQPPAENTATTEREISATTAPDQDPTTAPFDTVTPIISQPSATIQATTPVSTTTPVPIHTFTPTIPIDTNTPVPEVIPSVPADCDLGQSIVSDKDGMEQMCVPAGDFLMGAALDDPSANTYEQPQRTVYLDVFWIDKTEITNAQYAYCVDDGACEPPISLASEIRPAYFGNPKYDSYPVVAVRWKQANTYCEWAGRQLPTEAQWEKAARGIDGTTYPWGNAEVNSTLVNFGGGNGDTTAVGTYPDGASPYGALDMSGNVSEWTADWFSLDYYRASPDSNPPGPTNGIAKVLRGGSWHDLVSNLRTTRRLWDDPQSVRLRFGFRCAMPAVGE
jgi:formylglycine-generating enzyme required for sulfatase activity